MMNLLFTKTPLAYFVASFWRDEAFSYLMARLPLHTLLWSTAQDSNPPLYYTMLKLWMGLFGSSEVALRSLSLVFFWATLYVAFLIMNDVYRLSTRKSLLYLLLFIINPLLHYYAFEARMYSMMAFLATLLFYALMKKKYQLYAYVALGALFTHYFLFFVVAFQAVFILVTSHGTERRHFFIPLIKVSLWYVPWLIILLLARPPIGESFWVPPTNWKDIFILPAILLTGYEKEMAKIIPFMLSLSVITWGILIFGALHHLTRQKKEQYFLLLGWSLGIPLIIFFLSFIKPVFLPRYLIFAPVGMLLLLVVCFESLKNKYIRYVYITIFVLFSVSFSLIQVISRTKAPLKKTFNSIKNDMKTGDVVYVTHEYDFHPAEYYLSSKKVYIYKKTYEELPWFVGKVLIDKQSMTDTLPNYPVRAFIVNNDGSYTIQSLW